MCREPSFAAASDILLSRNVLVQIVVGSDPEPPERAYPGLKTMIRRTECDAQGNFLFAEIPNGTWFILTEVNARHGGVLIAELILPYGGTMPVLLSNKHVVGR